MGESNEEKYSRLDQKTKDMADDIREIKGEIKSIREDIVSLKITVAKFGVYLLVGIAIVEFLLRYFFKS